MFVRLKRSGSPCAVREYLQVVEPFRAQGKVRQRLIATLGRLWEQQALPGILARLAHGRCFGFDLERACFALVLQRRCAPGSDLQGMGWLPSSPAFSPSGWRWICRGGSTNARSTSRGRISGAISRRSARST